MGNSLKGGISNPDKIYGKSAYEIAVMHGFDGTEEEWVESLKGKIAFIRYSAYADGTSYTENWREGQNFIGFATDVKAPTTKSGYTWCRFGGEVGNIEGALDEIIAIQNALIGG